MRKKQPKPPIKRRMQEIYGYSNNPNDMCRTCRHCHLDADGPGHLLKCALWPYVTDVVEEISGPDRACRMYSHEDRV